MGLVLWLGFGIWGLSPVSESYPGSWVLVTGASPGVIVFESCLGTPILFDFGARQRYHYSARFRAKLGRRRLMEAP